MSIHKIMKDLESAKADYLSADHDEAPRKVLADKHAAVKAQQKALSEAIADGADPCPSCGAKPHGMMQPRAGGEGIEFEIGCLGCGYFLHQDGSARAHGARGGLLPKHTVEAWNSGPDFWKKKPRAKFSDAEWAALKPLKKHEAS